MANKPRELTEMQKAFLESLFGEAMGDPLKAKKLAGYSDNISTGEIVKNLKDEILDACKLYLAGNAARASIELVGLMLNPNQPSGTTKHKVITELMNRAGMVEKPEATDVNLKIPQGGIVILPAKGSKAAEEIIDAEEKEM